MKRGVVVSGVARGDGVVGRVTVQEERGAWGGGGIISQRHVKGGEKALLTKKGRGPKGEHGRSPCSLL